MKDFWWTALLVLLGGVVAILASFVVDHFRMKRDRKRLMMFTYGGPCTVRGPRGWRCRRYNHMTGPCAFVPRWWNWSPRAIKDRVMRHGQ